MDGRSHCGASLEVRIRHSYSDALLSALKKIIISYDYSRLSFKSFVKCDRDRSNSRGQAAPRGVSGKREANAVHRDVGAKAPFGRVRSNRFNLEVRPEPRYRSDEI